MSKSFLFIITCFLLASFLVNSCNKVCIEPRGIEGAGLTIRFFNSTNNEYFYPENTNLSPFKIDSLKVKDSNGKLLTTTYQLDQDSTNPLKRFYVIGIYPIFIPSDDQAAFDTEQTKFIYIRYDYKTFDTITLVYKAKKEKCINNYEYIKSYYKNVMVQESFNRPTGLRFTLNH